MDIFFVVTTAVVFAVGVLVLVILFYIVRILRSVDHISENLSAESDRLRSDISVLRTKLRDEGLRLKHFSEFFDAVARRAAHKRKKSETGE